MIQNSVFQSVENFSHNVGLIQCSVNGLSSLEHPSASLEVISHPVHGLIHEGTQYETQSVV